MLEPLGLYLARQRSGGTIDYSSPGYTALLDSAAPLGGKGVAIPLDGKLENDLPALSATIDERTLAVSLVNPHNPSGTLSDGAALDRFILDAAKRTLIDEAYLEYDDLARRSAIRMSAQVPMSWCFAHLPRSIGWQPFRSAMPLRPRP